MINVGMDVHNDSTVIDFFDPGAEPKAQHRTVTVRSTGEAITAALRPLQGRCRVAFEVGTQAQWVAEVVRPLAAEMMQTLTQGIDFLDVQLGQVERQLEAIAATQPAVALLRTIPGIGARTAEAIVAFTDRVGRFEHRKQFASYFGMTPTQNASGRIDRHGHISKRGPSVVRWVLVEAVHQVVRRCPVLAAFFDRIWRGRKDRYKKAIVATGRKLLTIAFAMQRDGQAFDPTKVAAAA